MFRLFGKKQHEDKRMKLIVGLGNPTAKYDRTRHNVGFEVIDQLSKEYNISVDTAKHKGAKNNGTKSKGDPF